MIPWKLIVVLVIAVMLALFIGFNLENKCEISFVFVRLDSVPVYMTILISFAAGLVAALPFAFKRRKAAKGGKLDAKKALPPAEEGGMAAVGATGTGESRAGKAGEGVSPKAAPRRRKGAGKKAKDS